MLRIAPHHEVELWARVCLQFVGRERVAMLRSDRDVDRLAARGRMVDRPLGLHLERAGGDRVVETGAEEGHGLDDTRQGVFTGGIVRRPERDPQTPTRGARPLWVDPRSSWDYR